MFERVCLATGRQKLPSVEFGDCNKSKKGLPLETKNTQNHENRKLGLTESLHMQHCSLPGCKRPLGSA